MIEPAGITCRELVEVITEYLEGSMAHGESARFEAHLDECEGCTRVIEQFRATISSTGSLAQDHLTAAERDLLLAAFRSWSRERDPDR